MISEDHITELISSKKALFFQLLQSDAWSHVSQTPNIVVHNHPPSESASKLFKMELTVQRSGSDVYKLFCNPEFRKRMEKHASEPTILHTFGDSYIAHYVTQIPVPFVSNREMVLLNFFEKLSDSQFMIGGFSVDLPDFSLTHSKHILAKLEIGIRYIESISDTECRLVNVSSFDFGGSFPKKLMDMAFKKRVSAMEEVKTLLETTEV
ncbi:hypothetical protein RCL1_005556 [Eukaryota sp. TZLM3-RCL]